MGADGGTIPKRCELIKNKTKKQKVERDVGNAMKWRICQLSQQTLVAPIVACPLGRLFNKVSLIEALITKQIAESKNAHHIRSLKDVRVLNLTINPAFDADQIDKGDVYKDYNVSPYICPVVGLEMNGNHRFLVNWTCGCVISEKAFKEVKSEFCHKCGGKPTTDDEQPRYVVLNGTDEEIEFYRRRLDSERAIEKKAKKSKKDADMKATQLMPPPQSSTDVTTKQSSASKRKIKDTSTSDTKSKQTKATIQMDPNTSSAYKSLFTTSEVAKNKPTAHWVTYNPLYY